MHTVLIVDDSQSIREFCRRELERAGYTARVAGSGREALAACEENPPDVVVLDLHMPGLDGLETMRELRSRASRIPVIFHTAHTDCSSFDLQGLTVQAWVRKSEDLAALKSAIGSVLGALDSNGELELRGKMGALLPRR